MLGQNTDAAPQARIPTVANKARAGADLIGQIHTRRLPVPCDDDQRLGTALPAFTSATSW
jgi:hypothetical protein